MTRDDFEAGGRALCELAGDDPDLVVGGQPAWLRAALGIVRLRWELSGGTLNSEPDELADADEPHTLH